MRTQVKTKDRKPVDRAEWSQPLGVGVCAGGGVDRKGKSGCRKEGQNTQIPKCMPRFLVFRVPAPAIG